MPLSKPTPPNHSNDHSDEPGRASPSIEILPATCEEPENGAGLSLRREAFCRAYVLDPNATRAAGTAGYAAPSARSQGSRLLTNVDIQNRIHDLRVELARRHAIDADVLIGKLEAVYLQAFEHYQMHACVRAVALQAQLAGTLGAGGTRDHSEPPIIRRREPAAPIAVHRSGQGAACGSVHGPADGQAAPRVGS